MNALNVLRAQLTRDLFVIAKFLFFVVLVPLLCLLYVSDIANVLPGENVKLFADDTNLFISGVDSCVLNQKYND